MQPFYLEMSLFVSIRYLGIACKGHIKLLNMYTEVDHLLSNKLYLNIQIDEPNQITCIIKVGVDT